MTDEIIQKLLETERRAQEIIKEAEIRRENIDDEIKSEISQMDESYVSKANARVSKVIEIEENAARERLEKLRGNTQAAGKKLQAIYDENKEEWLESLYKKLIG